MKTNRPPVQNREHPLFVAMLEILRAADAFREQPDYNLARFHFSNRLERSLIALERSLEHS